MFFAQEPILVTWGIGKGNTSRPVSNFSLLIKRLDNEIDSYVNHIADLSTMNNYDYLAPTEEANGHIKAEIYFDSAGMYEISFGHGDFNNYIVVHKQVIEVVDPKFEQVVWLSGPEDVSNTTPEIIQ